MDLQDLFHFSETFALDGVEDPYVVVARRPAESVLGLRLTLALIQVSNLEWLSICASLCARDRSRAMAPEAATKLFGAPDFYMENGECLTDCMLPLIAMPSSPAELHTVYKYIRPDLARNLVARLQEPLAKCGSVLAMHQTVLEDMIITRLDDLIPEVAATCNDTLRFKFVSELR